VALPSLVGYIAAPLSLGLLVVAGSLYLRNSSLDTEKGAIQESLNTEVRIHTTTKTSLSFANMNVETLKREIAESNAALARIAEISDARTDRAQRIIDGLRDDNSSLTSQVTALLNAPIIHNYAMACAAAVETIRAAPILTAPITPDPYADVALLTFGYARIPGFLESWAD